MTAFHTRLYRERRRLFLVTLTAGLSGFLFYWRLGEFEVNGIPLPLFTAGLYAVFVGLAAALICLLLPRFRFSMELFALSRLTFASLSAVSPTVCGMALGSPFVNAGVVVLGGAAIGAVLWRPRPGPSPYSPARGATHTFAKLGYRPDARGPGRLLHDMLADPAAPGTGARHWRTRLAAWLDDAHGRLEDAMTAQMPAPALRRIPVPAQA